MFTSIQGIYRKGKIEFAKQLDDIKDETPVIVTFLQSSSVDLREQGIDEAQAAELRSRLATFACDWESPEMDIYDRYDAVKASL